MFGLLALAVAGLFTGAAVYINVAEQPARLKLSDAALLTEWQPAYKRGYAMQAPLAIIGFLCGLIAWWQTGNAAFLVGGLLMVANWPWTLIAMMPTNKTLMDTVPKDNDPAIRQLILTWGKLHAVRSALGALALASFLFAHL
jgi:hypothetical protein